MDNNIHGSLCLMKGNYMIRKLMCIQLEMFKKEVNTIIVMFFSNFAMKAGVIFMTVFVMTVLVAVLQLMAVKYMNETTVQLNENDNNKSERGDNNGNIQLV